MNIVLIGMSGAGKTTIGKLLSEKTDYEFIDSDLEIEKKLGTKIDLIFKENGESFFRKKESDIIESLSKMEGVVVATGGGVILNPNNINKLKENGILIYLEASIDTLIRNLNNSMVKRPLLEKNLQSSLNKMYNERKGLYEKYCDFGIDVNNKSKEDIVMTIIRLISIES